MAISTNGTVLTRLAGALYNTQMSNATYKEVASLDPSALANTLYARDFSSSTDLAVATTLVTNLGLSSVTGLDNWVAAQLTAAGAAKGAKVVDLLNSFAQMTADTTYGAYATAFNTKVDAALALSQTTDNAGGTFAAAGTPISATFALTAGTDTKTLGAGDDTINATVATLGALDVVNGGAGNDTLNVVDTSAVASLGGATFSGIEKVNISAGGAVGSVSSPAGVAVAASAQEVKAITLASVGGTATTVDVVINGQTYTSATFTASTTAATAAANAAAAVATTINRVLGSSVAAQVGSTAEVAITSPFAGTPLPTITANAIGFGDGSGTTEADNAVKTAATAQKQVITLSTAFSGSATAYLATDTYTVHYNGVAYGPIYPGVAGTNATAAAAIATLINSAAGSTIASASGPVVTVTAPTAGTPLPLIHAVAGGASTQAAVSQPTLVAANMTTVAAAVDAATVTAPSGTTSYTVSAVGDANIAGVTTSAIDVTGVNVKASGGNGTKVTASGSVYVSGSTGEVAITETAVNPTGGFYVATSATTGLNGAWGSTSANKTGTLVTGGTAVTVTGKAGTANTTGTAVSTTDTSAVQIGSPANVGVSSSNQATGKETILNSALNPTGNVTVSSSSPFTFVDTTNKLSLSSVIYGSGDVKAYMNGGTTASVTGANTVTVTDMGTTSLKADAATATAVGASNLTTATVNGLNGTNAAATITSDALTNLTVVDARGATSLGVTVTNNTVGHALNLTVGNSGTSSLPVTIADAKATSVTVASQASAYQALGTTAITSGSGSYVTLNTPLATSVTATNAHKVNFGDLTASGYAKVATIDASAATGAITATVGAVPLQGLAITGGSGKDEITLKASTSQSSNATSGANLSVNLGAGDDKLLNGNTTVHTIVGATFNGGEGNDLLSASLLNSGNAAQFTSFEVLGLDLTTDGASFDTTILAGAAGLQLLANAVSSGHTVTYSGVSTSQGLTVAANMGTSVGTTVLGFSSAVVNTGTADAYTVTFAGVGATAAAATPTDIKAATLSLAGIETINIASQSASGFTSNSVTLADANARTVVATGSQALTVAFASGFGGSASVTASTDATGVDSIDTTALTGNLTINTSNIATSYRATNAGLTVNTGSGADAITLAQVAVVNAGAGDDTITAANGAGTSITGGTGINKFVVASAVGTTAEVTITDLKSKDVIDMAGTVTAGSLGLKTDVSAATSLASALEIANGSSSSAVALSWFQYAGNTYIYSDLADSSSAVGGLDANDNIVKITGLIDLNGSAFTTGAVITIA
jgi:hypothetical protein